MSETTTAVLDGEDEFPITELVEFDPTRLDGVKSGANGFPVLLMKSLAPAEVTEDIVIDVTAEQVLADALARTVEKAVARGDDLTKAMSGGKVDEAPDISTGRQIMTLLGHAIGAEAEELGAGNYGEVRDVRMLASAADIISAWLAREQAVADGKDPDAPCGCCQWCSGIGCGCCPGCGCGTVMCSAADEAVKAAESTASQNDLPDSAFAYIEDGGTKDSDGKTTPRSKRHFPVHDEAHAKNALARLSSSPFGDKAKAKVHAAARKFGIEISSDSKKGAVVAGQEADVDTVTKSEDTLTKSDLAEAVTKATEPLQAEIASLRGQVAKVLALPQPGGPVLAVTQAPKKAGPGAEDFTAKAAYFRAKADQVDAPDLADGYRQLALEEDAKAAAAT